MVEGEVSLETISEVMNTIKKQNEVKEICLKADEIVKRVMYNYGETPTGKKFKGYTGYLSMFLLKVYDLCTKFNEDNKNKIRMSLGEDDTVLTDEKEPVGIMRFSDDEDGFVLHLDTYSMYKGNPRYYVKK